MKPNAILKLLHPVPLVTVSGGILAGLVLWIGMQMNLNLLVILAMIVMIAIIWALVLWILRLRTAKAGTALEASIQAQAQKQIASSRPGREKDIEQLRNNLLEAIAALKASRVGKGKKGTGVLYVLPWYMIIGPPGSGKSTLLQNSGLNFPYLDPNRSRSVVKGVGGTRNCDWWFADSAVILDTAGRWTLPAEADDTQEWLGFLDLLRKHRPRKPINGLIVGVSIQDLLSGSEEELEVAALKIRSRIDELIKQLGVTFPIYVLFTKCDLIRGFVEFFGDLSRNERAQVWGATVARDRAGREAAYRIFETEIDRLTDAVATAKVRRLAETTQPEARPEVLFFPVQFAALKTRLSRFMEALFRANPYQELPIFRGFYFTSGTQEGRSIDQVINAMLKGFGVPATAEGMIVEPSQTKSYFIEDVFSKIAFPDRNMAGPSAHGERRRRALRMKTFVTGGAVLLAFLGALLGLFSVNHGLVYDAKNTADRVGAAATSSRGMMSLEDLRQVAQLRRKLEEMDGRHRPLVKAAFLGTYQGERAADRGRRMLFAALGKGFFEPADPILADLLKRETKEPDYRRYYQWYHTWYLIQNPAAGRLRTRRDAEQASAALADVWASMNAGTPTSREEYRRTLLETLDYAVQYRSMFGDLFRPGAGDPSVETVASETIRRGWERVDGVMTGLTGAAAGVPPITVTTFVSPDFGVTGRGQVPGAFTIEAQRGPVRSYFAWADSARADLILNDAFRGSGPPSIQSELAERYANAYEGQWIAFLEQADLTLPSGDAETHVFLQRASTEDSPVLKILRGVHDNTSFDKNGRALAGAASIARSFQLIDELLSPTSERGLLQQVKGVVKPGKAPYQEYLDQVAALRDAYSEIAKSGNPGQAQEVLEISTWVEDHIPTNTPLGREVARLLKFPSFAVSKQVQHAHRAATGTAIASEWSAVYAEYAQTLAGRYPLRAEASEEVARADFESFFGPSGTFWKFFEASLAEVISEDGSKVLNPDAPVAPELRECVRRAYRIRKALFAPGSDKLEFSLSLSPGKVDKPADSNIALRSSRLMIGGGSLLYRMGPQVRTEMTWPGPSPMDGASLSLDLGSTATAKPLRSEGFWGFFRLLDDASVSGSGGSATISWTVPTDKGDVRVPYQVSGLSAVNPLGKGLLRFSCPERIEAAP